MANRVREEETDAADVIAAILDIPTPVHADSGGQADLRFTSPGGDSATAEVTFLTDHAAKVAKQSWMIGRERDYVAASLAWSWHVVLHEGRTWFKELANRLEPHLATLEQAGVTEVDDYAIYSIKDPVARGAVVELCREGVSHASVFPTRDPDVRKIFTSIMGGYTACGSEATLAAIEAYVAARLDNLVKLDAAGTSERHLFVWMDSDTPMEIAAPFTSTQATEWDHFGLPGRPPILPDEVTHLWVVHHGTGRGWLWVPVDGWRQIDYQSIQGPLSARPGDRRVVFRHRGCAEASLGGRRALRGIECGSQYSPINHVTTGREWSASVEGGWRSVDQ